MARHEDIGIRRLFMSVYRAAYALLVLRFVRLVYHKLFPKLDYDYEHAKRYILAYFPPGCPGMPLFATNITSKAMLAWFENAKSKMQPYLIKGTIRLITEEVPDVEIKFGYSGQDLAIRMISDGIRGSKEEFAALLLEFYVEAKKLASNG
jgi:hypothetical protein